jgi:hypothetical protein
MATAKKAPAKKAAQEGSTGEEGSRQEGSSGKEGRRQEGAGKEGRSEEGSGEEGRCKEGSCQEGGRQEGACEEGCCQEGPGEKGCGQESREKARCQACRCRQACCCGQEARSKEGSQSCSARQGSRSARTRGANDAESPGSVAVPDGQQALSFSAALKAQSPAPHGVGLFYWRRLLVAPKHQASQRTGPCSRAVFTGPAPCDRSGSSAAHAARS